MLRFRKNKIAALLLTLLWSWSIFGNAQELYFKNANIVDPESEMIINDYCSDDEGLVWIASSEGLLFTDGESYSYIAANDSVLSKELNAIFFKDDKLYLGSNLGYLSVFSIPEKRMLKTIKIESNEIRTIIIGPDNNTWIGTKDKGIIYIKNDEVNYLDINYGLADNVVNDLLLDSLNACVWAATDRGLSKCLIGPKITFENFTNKNGLPDNLLTSLEMDKENNVWIGAYSGTLSFLDSKNTITEVHAEGDSFTDKIVDLNYKNQELWIAYENNGIRAINTQEKTRKNLLAKSKLEGIKKLKFIHNDHLLLLSSDNIFFIGDKNIRFYPHLKEFDLSATSAIYKNKNGEILIANTKYILRKNENDSIDILIDLKKENIDYVISLFEDQDGVLWFGTFDQGIYSFTNGLLTNYKESDGLINNNVMTICEFDGSIWCGTLGGLSEIDKNADEIRFKNYSSDQGLEAAYIYQLWAVNGNLFIASDGEGLIVYNKESFKKIAPIEAESIYNLCGVNDSTLFLSCDKGRILKLVNTKEREVYTIKNNNRAVDLSGIIQLDGSHVLFTWEQGIGLLNITNGNYQLFNAAWGLEKYQNDFLNEITKDNNGNVWIGSNEYLLKIESAIGLNTLKPKSILSSKELFSTPIDTGIYNFSYDENHFTFHLNSLWYQDPKNVDYQYRLIGLDDKWISTKDKVIIYPKLPAGKYRFEFRSGLNYHMKDVEILSYSFKINKPYYASWWFFVLIALLFLSGIYGFIQNRDKKAIQAKKMEYERVLSQFELLKSQINPHFLFNSLNTAYVLISKNGDEARDYILSLSKYLRAILAKNQEHVITLEKELTFAENYAALQKKRFAENLQVSSKVESTAMLESFIPPLTLQILIENAIKHNIISKTNPLFIEIYTEGDFLIIKNNLQIKKSNGEGTKIGLSNIKSRYQILFNESIEINSTETSFIVKLPIVYNYAKDIIN